MTSRKNSLLTAAKRTREQNRTSARQAVSDHDVQSGTDKYQSFIENLPVLFYAVKPEPPYSPIYVSPGFEIFGYPLDEWITDENIWLRVIHEDDRNWVFNITKASTRTGEKVEYEYRVIAADGSVRWVRDQGCLIRDKNGNVIHRQGVIADITEHRLADQELQKREKLYRTLVRHIPRTAVLLFDRDYRFTLADGDQLKAQGYTRKEFENRTLWEAFPKEISDEWAGYFRSALAGEHLSFERKTEEGWYHVYVIPVRDERGEIFSGMLIWQDITERKRAEEDLQESESRFRNLFENASDIIYVHDLQGNYISINHAAERVFGYTRDEALLMNMADIAAPGQLRVMRQKLASKRGGDATQTSYDLDCITKVGRRITLEINSRTISKDGVPIAVQGIARDVTERKQAEQALRESEAKFRTLAETASDAIITIDAAGTMYFVNAATEKIFGYKAKEMVGKNLTILIPERFRNAHKAGITRLLNRRKGKIRSRSIELPGLHKKGHEIELELSFAEYNMDGGRYFTSVIRDVTDRKRAQEALKESESRFRDLFENANDLIYTHDLKGNFTSLNRAGERITGYSRQEAHGLGIADVVAPEYLEYAQRMTMRKLNGDAPSSYELEIIAKDGRRVMLELSTRLIYHNDQPVGVQGIGRDITSRRHAEDQLLHNALHDSLTDLPNRTEFMRHLHGAVERSNTEPGSRFAVLFLDLDRFKVINDSLGHIIGDKLLVGIAKRLRTCVRPGDVVARLGGDEFTVLLNSVSGSEEATMVADRLQRNLSAPFKFGNYEVFTSASIGIIVSDEIQREPEDFLRDADTAMYRAKEAGKARCEVFDREMHVRNMNLLQVETDLRRALERHEFEVFYQPIVPLETGRVAEFEALIRWNHPVHGMVQPSDFITVAEETGLIVPIGRWILEEACRQTRKWQETYGRAKSLCISVNLSAKQLMHPALRSQVEDILRATGLKPNCLKLEVTESTVIERSETALAVLSQLRALGLSFSTDDFGTGYSSLSYLHRFPFGRLKIDRSFIEKMEHDAKSEAIVRTILLLGQNLNMDVVAEGIETARQLEMLKMLGCRFGQGFIFSQPIPAAAAEELLTDDAAPLGPGSMTGLHDYRPLFETTEIQ